MLTDPAFTGTTFAVIDFETLTPAGRPPVPIEVAVISGRFTREGDWAESGRFQSLMHPLKTCLSQSSTRPRPGSPGRHWPDSLLLAR